MMTQTPDASSAQQSSSEQPSETERTVTKETAREAAMRLLFTNARCRIAPKSERGYVIVGAKG